MHRFTTHDRAAPMTHTVSYHDVPMPRAIAFALHHCESHGARVSVASCIRVDSVIAEHNRQFHTNLHGQQWLIDMHAKDPVNYASANPPMRTSHCWRSDGSPVYRDQRGRLIAAGGKLPWYQVGIDVDDLGKVEDNSHLLYVAGSLGYAVVRPYSAGSEHHHIVFAQSPIPTLEHANQISKVRMP